MKIRLLTAAFLAVGLAIPGSAAKPGALAADRIETAGTFSLTSRDFAAGGEIPKRFADDGDRMSPPLAWSGLPEGTKSLALIMEAPGSKPTVHWVAWNLDPQARSIARGSVTPGARVGRNSRGTPGYVGPRPSRTPRPYHFQMFALDSQLDLRPGSSREQVMAAMRGRVLGEAVLVGTYGKP